MSDDEARNLLKKALGGAYSELVVGDSRNLVVGRLRVTASSEPIKRIVPAYLAQLKAVVSVRSLGGRCACHISQTKLGLLREALDAGYTPVAESSRS